jgi:hypothetical protein
MPPARVTYYTTILLYCSGVPAIGVVVACCYIVIVNVLVDALQCRFACPPLASS